MINRIILLSVSLLVLLSGIAFGADGAVTAEMVKKYKAEFDKNEANKFIINAVTNNSIKALSLNHELAIENEHYFDIEVKRSGIINQKSSGRCWMFAGINVVAPRLMKQLDLSDFEMSESYIAFYDKLEKANNFLERMIELRDRKIDDRSLSGEIKYVFGDGGWWHYFTDLVKKYGVVPKATMPETKQSSATGSMNRLGVTLLRSYAAELRRMHVDGKKVKHLRARKEEMLSDIYKLLVFNYGKPPETFTFRYELPDDDDDADKDKDKNEVIGEEETDAEHSDNDADVEKDDDAKDDKEEIIEEEHTPKSFFDKYFGADLPEYVAITNVPTKKFNTPYKMDASRNIYETEDFLVLNMPIEKLKEYAYKSIVDSQGVWFACDVGKQNLNSEGIFRDGIYDYQTTFGIDFSMTKSDRIDYGVISPNHAMTLTAVDTSSTGQPVKWQVENSWGTKSGDGGKWVMYDNWFDEYVLLVMVDKSLLSEDDAKLLEKKPEIIADWEPFFLALRNLE